MSLSKSQYNHWVENVGVCERAIKFFPNVQKFIESNEKSLPGSATCDNVVNACHDTLAVAKISFFSCIGNILQPFLKKFQSSKLPKPMAPFLYENIFILLKQLMQNIVKDTKIEKAKKLEDLFSIDLDDSINLKLKKNTDTGIVTANYLRISKASESEKQNFLAECFLFVKNTMKKILERMSKKMKLISEKSADVAQIDAEICELAKKKDC